MALNYTMLLQGFPLFMMKKTKSEYIEFLDNQDLEEFFQFAKKVTK